MYTCRDKKYTFTVLSDGRIQIDRRGEEWLILEKGSNAIVALLGDIEDMQKELDNYQTNESWVQDHGTNL